MNKENLKNIILKNLSAQGFILSDSLEISDNSEADKKQIRRLHTSFKTEKLFSEKEFVLKNLKKLSRYFANGSELNPKKIKPALYLVKPYTEFSDLFRLTTLLWSVPVSNGFGRRLRFLVLDESNGKIIGIFALGDPVFNLRDRDNLIAWNQSQRKDRLYNVLDLYIAGAVPPYSQLLCGKLMAMLSSSNLVREYVWRKYQKNITTIRRQEKPPHLVLITTLSALGKSSIYNRIKFNDRLLFQRIGETSGWGHFHLANSSFELMCEYLAANNHPIIKNNRFGQGPNWKIRTIRTCLNLLKLPENLLHHGVRREIYICPLSKNYAEYLRGETEKPIYYQNNIEELIEYFKKRWLIPRSERVETFKNIKAKEILKEFEMIKA